MKKLFIFGLTLTTMLGSLSSCSSDDVTEQQQGERKELTIKSVSRVGDSNFTSDFGMFVLSGSGAYKGNDDAKNNKVSFADGKWNLAKSLWLYQEEGNMYCYFPYSSTLTDATAIPMDLTTGTDYLYSEAKKVSAASQDYYSLEVTFKHALVKVNINIDKTAQSMTAKNVPTAKTFNLVTKEFGKASANGDLAVVNNSIYLFPGVAPKFNIVIDGTTYEYQPSQTFTGGAEYTYTLTTSEKHIMEITGVKVSDWSTGGSYTDDVF